jgi:hypothetical protein
VRTLFGVLALAAGAAIAGGLAAVICAGVAALILLAAATRPAWPTGPTVVAAALIVQVGLADERAGWRTWLAALVLAIFLAGSEIAQTGAWRAGWQPAMRAHRRAGAVVLVSVAVPSAAATATVPDPALTTLLIGLAAAATLITVAVLHGALR